MVSLRDGGGIFNNPAESFRRAKISKEEKLRRSTLVDPYENVVYEKPKSKRAEKKAAKKNLLENVESSAEAPEASLNEEIFAALNEFGSITFGAQREDGTWETSIPQEAIEEKKAREEKSAAEAKTLSDIANKMANFGDISITEEPQK